MSDNSWREKRYAFQCAVAGIVTVGLIALRLLATSWPMESPDFMFSWIFLDLGVFLVLAGLRWRRKPQAWKPVTLVAGIFQLVGVVISYVGLSPLVKPAQTPFELLDESGYVSIYSMGLFFGMAFILIVLIFGKKKL